MAEAKPIDYQKEAWYTMKNQNYMMSQALRSIRETIDGPNTSPEEIIISIRKTVVLYVGEARQE